MNILAGEAVSSHRILHTDDVLLNRVESLGLPVVIGLCCLFMRSDATEHDRGLLSVAHTLNRQYGGIPHTALSVAIVVCG